VYSLPKMSVLCVDVVRETMKSRAICMQVVPGEKVHCLTPVLSPNPSLLQATFLVQERYPLHTVNITDVIIMSVNIVRVFSIYLMLLAAVDPGVYSASNK
jgi:hypothetical protein